MKLFVGNLPFQLSEEELYNHFGQFGKVASAKIITDRESGRSRGFGFVEMPNDDEGRTAIAELDGRELNGRELRVSEAKPQDRERGGGGFRPPGHGPRR